MKKFLLALFLLGAGFVGLHAQQRDLWFNEMFTTPVKSNSEFIELYNTSNSDINLDCYIIVSYVAPGTTGFGTGGGAYVYNFPTNSKITKLSYYLLASNSSLDFKANGQGGSRTITPSDPTKFSDWSKTITGGYITKYNYDGTSWSVNAAGANLQNIMPADGALLLYKINSDGSTALVNGIFGGNLPSAVPQLNDLTNLPSSSSCFTGNVSIKFKNQGIGASTVDIATVAASTGQDHGYAKIGNGLCGSWAKTQTFSEFTPGSKNPTTLGTITKILTTTQKIICGNRIDFKITSPTGSSAQSGITVYLYVDNDKDGVLDGAIDGYVATYPTTLSSGTNTVYSFTNIPAITTNQQYLVVYKTSLGCFDQAVAPIEGNFTITSAQRNVCGNKVDFEVTAISADLLSFGAPITANAYADLAPVGTLGANDVLIGSQQVTTAGTTTYSIAIPKTPTDYSNTPMLLQFTSSAVCFTSPAVAVASLAPVTTEVAYQCNTISVSVTPPNADAARYSAPLIADIYLDRNNTGELGNNDRPITTFTFNTLTAGTATTQSYIITDKSLTGKNILVVYHVPAAASCITPAAQTKPYVPTAANGPVNAIGSFPRTGPVSYKIRSTTNQLAYPFTVLVYEDRNSNNRIDNGDVALDAPKVIEFPPTDPDATIYSTTSSYPEAYNVIIRFLGTCITKDIPVASGVNINLPVTFTSFTASRKGDKVALIWETATELNNKGFYIQRRTTGEWKDVGFVFSQAQAGNSSAGLAYSFSDVNLHKGVSQYRILQVDLDGTGHYSAMRSIDGSAASSKMLLFPNPSATGSVTLVFENDGMRQVAITDVAGRVVKQYRNHTEGSLTVSGLANGFYTVRVTNAATGAATVDKFIIKKR